MVNNPQALAERKPQSFLWTYWAYTRFLINRCSKRQTLSLCNRGPFACFHSNNLHRVEDSASSVTMVMAEIPVFGRQYSDWLNKKRRLKNTRQKDTRLLTERTASSAYCRVSTQYTARNFIINHQIVPWELLGSD